MSGLILKIPYLKKKFQCYLSCHCPSVENNLLAASEGVEICSVVFRNSVFISNAEYNYDIIFLENDLRFFSCFASVNAVFLIVSHWINVIVVYN